MPPKTTISERGAANRAALVRSWRDIRTRDRVILVVFTPLIIAFSLLALGGLWRWTPEGVLLQIVRVVALEGAAGLVIVTVSMFIYALAKPRWALWLLEHYLATALVFMTALGLAMVIAMLILWT